MIYVAVLTIVVIALGAVAAWLNAPRTKGRRGEALVERALAHLDPGQFRVLHNVTLPATAGRTTQIDHVVISRYGIFVIETKHLAGWIFGKAGEAQWTQTFGRGRKTTFQNPLRQNHAHVKALQAATGLDDDAFEPMVIMTGTAVFKNGIPRGVWALRDLAKTIQAMPRQRLTDTQVTAAANAIEAARLPPGPETDREHIDTTTRHHGGIVSQAGKLIYKGAMIRMALKLATLAVSLAIAFAFYLFIKDFTADFAERHTGAHPSPSPAASAAPKTDTPARPTTTAAAPELTPAKASGPAPLPKDVRCAYSVDTDRCACLDERGFRIEAGLEQCKARAEGRH